MKKVAGCALALACAMVGMDAGVATAAPECGDQQAAITVTAPSYVNAGKEFEAEIRDVAPAGAVTGLAVTLGGVAVPSQPPALGTQILPLTAPSALGRTQLTVTWEQADGAVPAALACSGRVDLGVTVVAASARIGDTAGPNVNGLWIVVITPLNYDARTSTQRLRLRPACDVGACSFRSERRLYRADGDGVHYTATVDFARPIAGCRTGRGVVKRAFIARATFRLRVTKQRRTATGLLQATRMDGTSEVVMRPTGAARAAGCRTGGTLRERAVVLRQ